MQQSLIVKNRLYRRLDAQPATIGVPWAREQLRGARRPARCPSVSAGSRHEQ